MISRVCLFLVMLLLLLSLSLLLLFQGGGDSDVSEGRSGFGHDVKDVESDKAFWMTG